MIQILTQTLFINIFHLCTDRTFLYWKILKQQHYFVQITMSKKQSYFSKNFKYNKKIQRKRTERAIKWDYLRLQRGNKLEFLQNMSKVLPKQNLCSYDYFLLIIYMFVLQKIRRTVSKIDMFSSSEMLRYNDEAQYQTFTGGIISLGIILTVIAGFFSMISETVNRTAISSSLNVITSANPSTYNLTANTQSMFMFGVQIQSMDQSFFYDMNGPRRYFDVNVLAGTLKYGVIQKLQAVSLVQCTDQHWQMLPNLIQNRDLLQYNTWLCPQINAELPLTGSYLSDVYHSVQFSVSKCTNQSEPSRPCYPQNEIDELMSTYGNFYFQVNYINTVINPNEVEYRSYYIQAMDYVIFSAAQGSEIYYQFSDFQIQTDTSIWPFSSFTVDQGILVPNKATGISYMVDETEQYVFAYFTKSKHSYSYTRQVQKLSVVFSYIGGLVGAVSATLFILKLYTDMSLEVSIARSLFKQEENIHENPGEQKPQSNDTGQKGRTIDCHQFKQQKFGLTSFVKLHLYQLFKVFKCTQNWDEMRQLQEFREEIGKHLDIKNLLKRIINIQRYLTYVFDEKQLECLKHQKPMTFDKIKQLRKLFTQETHRENAQVKQLTGIERQLSQIDTNICKDRLEYSINQQSGLRTPQPFFKFIKEDKSESKVLPIADKSVIFHSKNKILGFSSSDEVKIKEYFSELRSEKEFNIINRKICQNAKSNLIQANYPKTVGRAEQISVRKNKKNPFLEITSKGDQPFQ